MSALKVSTLAMKGSYKIWKTHKVTGESKLVVDKNNLILYGGADLAAYALAGRPYASISHMYIGYKTDGAFDPEDFTPPTIDKDYSVPFTDYNSTGLEGLGYLRVPLAYNPTFLATTNYEHNTAVFTGVVSNSVSAFGGEEFHDSSDPDPSYLFEIGLVAALDPTNAAHDLVFSRANFEPIEYDANFNFTISWAIQFTA